MSFGRALAIMGPAMEALNKARKELVDAALALQPERREGHFYYLVHPDQWAAFQAARERYDEADRAMTESALKARPSQEYLDADRDLAIASKKLREGK